MLIYERIKIKRSFDLGSRFVYENIFDVFVFCMFFVFLNNRTKNETIGARK